MFKSHLFDVKFKQDNVEEKSNAQRTSTDKTFGMVPQAGFYDENTMKATLISETMFGPLLKEKFEDPDYDEEDVDDDSDDNLMINQFKKGKLRFRGKQYLQVHAQDPELFRHEEETIDFVINQGGLRSSDWKKLDGAEQQFFATSIFGIVSIILATQVL